MASYSFDTYPAAGLKSNDFKFNGRGAVAMKLFHLLLSTFLENRNSKGEGPLAKEEDHFATISKTWFIKSRWSRNDPINKQFILPAQYPCSSDLESFFCLTKVLFMFVNI